MKPSLSEIESALRVFDKHNIPKKGLSVRYCDEDGNMREARLDYGGKMFSDRVVGKCE